MSLLDDVSIVVTPNGYKAGELYAVIPVPTEGAELGDTGTISNNAGGVITKTSSLNYNATSDGTSSTASKPKLDSFSLTVGKRYRITIAPSNQSGTINFDVNNDGTLLTENNDLTSNLEFDFTNGSNFRIVFDGTLTFNCDFVISLKELTSADMDVTRATAATRVDENGLVNYAEVLGGEEVTDGNFPTPNTAWDKTETWSIENNYATATANSLSQYIQQDFTITNAKTYLFTYEIIENTLNGNGASLSGSGGFVSVSLSSVIGTHQVYITADDSGAAYALKIGVSGTATTGTIKLDNVSVKEVTRDNVPRIDYTGGGCPHILAEPQRTNLYSYSNDTTTWVKSNFTATNNYAISPDGTQNAFRGVSTQSGSLLYIGSTGSAGTNTISIYAKSNTASDQKFRFFGNGNTTSSSDQTATQEWQRFEYTETYSFLTWGLLGASVSETNDILFYGMQHEVGSYPTSLIPTSGSTVTRNQDIFTRDGIGSLINSTEGVLFVEVAALSTVNANHYIAIGNGVSSPKNLIGISLYNGSNNILFDYYENNVESYHIETVTDITQFNKIAVSYNGTNVKGYVNGLKVWDVTVPAFSVNTFDRLNFDLGYNQNHFFGKVKQLQVYDTALTDEQLLQLTGESGTDFYESYAEMASALTYTIQ